MTTKSHVDVCRWAGLLAEAVSRPGMISEAYRAFHTYSVGNQLLAFSQCAARGLLSGPLSTYPGWLAKGRQVRRGERAIVLCMPLMGKRRPGPETEGEGGNDEEVYTRFVYRANWFVLDQTEGEPVETPAIPGWEKARALDTLGITEVPFDHPDGNCLGYAKGREIAVNPVNPMPWKTVFHELGHCFLGHACGGRDG